MVMKHLLLEVFCDGDAKGVKKPSFCELGIGNPTFRCFENQCKYLSYTKTLNELAYVDENGLVSNDDFAIAFGGDMLPEKAVDDKKMLKCWEDICKRKIEEAYNEYLEEIARLHSCTDDD